VDAFAPVVAKAAPGDTGWDALGRAGFEGVRQVAIDSSSERVDDPPPGEPGEMAVGGVERRAVLDGERREVGVA